MPEEAPPEAPVETPGRFEARFLKSYFTFTPVFADVSINLFSCTCYSFAKAIPSSRETYRVSSSSILFATINIYTSSPLC